MAKVRITTDDGRLVEEFDTAEHDLLTYRGKDFSHPLAEAILEAMVAAAHVDDPDLYPESSLNQFYRVGRGALAVRRAEKR